MLRLKLGFICIAFIFTTLKAQVVEKTFDPKKITEIPYAETQALLSLYNSTNGQNWKKDNNWKISNTPSSWYGVTVIDGHVVKITLINNNLTGKIPSNINLLTHLELLYLFGNSIGGTIPKELTELSNLVRINLWNNKLES